MQVPKCSCLFGQAVGTEPRVLVIPRVIKTANAVGNAIVDLSFLYKLFHGCAIKKEIVVGVGSIDASISFTDIFCLSCSGFGICSLSGLLPGAGGNKKTYHRGPKKIFHTSEAAKAVPRRK